MRRDDDRIWNNAVHKAVAAKAIPTPDTRDSRGLWWSDSTLARWFKRIDSFTNRDEVTSIVCQFSAK